MKNENLDLSMARLGSIVYCKNDHCEIATGNEIGFPNGILRFVMQWSSDLSDTVQGSLTGIILRRTVNDEEEFLVAETLTDKILVYQRETGSNKLKLKNEIQAIVGLDNFSVGDDGYIYVGGHSDPWVRIIIGLWKPLCSIISDNPSYGDFFVSVYILEIRAEGVFPKICTTFKLSGYSISRNVFYIFSFEIINRKTN